MSEISNQSIETTSQQSTESKESTEKSKQDEPLTQIKPYNTENLEGSLDPTVVEQPIQWYYYYY